MSSISATSCGSCASSQALNQQVSVAVAGKRLDALRLSGEALAKLLDDAVQLSRHPDKGGQLDLVG